tara:strand:+ start:20316 stop:20714 length:399 start_codon:yes stop_codon:yes gene_type:complete
MLSSRQALQYHMKSSKCLHKSSSEEKMRLESEIIIECTRDGYIKDYKKKGTPLRCSSIIGKSLYDLIDDTSKYELSLVHIQALAHKEGVFRQDSIIINSVLCSEIISFSCIITADDICVQVYLSDGIPVTRE